MRNDTARDDKAYARALEILERRANGHALPILRQLACRGYATAMNVMSDFLPDKQALALLRSGSRKGDACCAYNIAIVHLNRGDLRGYRHALAQAARSDDDAAVELRQFRTRFPHEMMRRFRRLSPERDE